MTAFYRLLLPVFCGCCFTATVTAQTIAMGSTDRRAGCSGTFVDSGGSTGDHAASGSTDTIVLCPGPGTTNTAIRLEFTDIALEGSLTLFDGESVTDDTLRQLGRINNGQPVSVTATTRNGSGCITVVFRSEGQRAGWRAALSCVAPCQAIVAEITASEPVPNADGFIRSCPGDPISLTGSGIYPDSGSNYDQSDGQSDFRWRFGDGTTREGREVAYPYAQEGSYLATLEITDQRGCQSSNRVSRRIGVLSGPELTIAPGAPPPLCPNEQLRISTSPTEAADLIVTALPRTLRFENAADSVRRIDIPASSDEVRSSVLRLDGFAADRKITSVADLESLCLDIEHSFIGDLTMWLECPEGQRLDLLRYAPTNPNTAGKQRFGYGDRDNTGPEESETYCWTPGADRTVDEQAASMPPAGTRPPILPFDRPYRPLGDGFAELIGCSLNGPWTLFVRDLSPEDDGTVYSFDLTFSDELEANRSRITVTDAVELVAVDELQTTDGSRGSFTPSGPGYYHLPVRGAPGSGCATDTFVRIDVQSPFSAPCRDCGPPQDTTVTLTVCANTPLQLSPVGDSPASESLRYVAREYATVSTTSVASVLSVSGMQPARFSAEVEALEQLCVDLRTEGDLASARVLLRAPGGREIVVAGRGTLSGRRFQECFTVSQLPGLGDLGDSPTNGDWQLLADTGADSTLLLLEAWSISFVRTPELTYSWSGDTELLSCTDCPAPELTAPTAASVTLTTETTDGCMRSVTYRVGVTPLPDTVPVRLVPACPGESSGRIEPAIDLENFTLRWSDGTEGPELIGAAPGTYELTVSAASGCSRTFTYELPAAQDPRIAAEILDERCAGSSDGRITLQPQSGENYRYGWPNALADSTTATVGGLPAGNYPISVFGPAGCRLDTVITLSAPEPISVGGTVTDPSCAGDSDGRITLEVTGGTTPYTVDWGDGGDSLRRGQLPAGSFPVSVVDARGCSVDTLLELAEPEPLTLVLRPEAVVCAGDASGELSIEAGGGSGRLTYQIGARPAQSTPFAGGLEAGSYRVGVTDSRGCSLSDTVTIAEGNALSVDVGPDLDLSFGDSTVLRGLVSGGAPPLSFRWFSDVNAQLPCTDCRELPITPLFSGLYRLTVTDARTCSASDDLRIRVVRDRRFAVPSAFSPNGDGRNDRLRVFGGPGTQVQAYRVYNRWGALILETGDFPVGETDRGWDGTNEAGTLLPAGTYVYTIEVIFPDGVTERKTGTVQLIR